MKAIFNLITGKLDKLRHPLAYPVHCPPRVTSLFVGDAIEIDRSSTTSSVPPRAIFTASLDKDVSIKNVSARIVPSNRPPVDLEPTAKEVFRGRRGRLCEECSGIIEERFSLKASDDFPRAEGIKRSQDVYDGSKEGAFPPRRSL